jgi:hypothetical protein
LDGGIGKDEFGIKLILCSDRVRLLHKARQIKHFKILILECLFYNRR